MAPNISNTEVLHVYKNEQETKQSIDQLPPRKYTLVWRNIILYIILHVSAFVGIYVMFTSAKWLTILQSFMLYQLGCLGVTAGAHRLWSHRSYKAKLPLRILLVLLQTLAFQDSVIDWCRNHRVHHKYSETDADPHNAKRGFFFCHMGWLLCRHHPSVRQKRKCLDMTDLTEDTVLAFQKKYYLYLMPVVCFYIPTATSVYLWGETWFNSWYMNMLRYAVTLHVTWLVNSVAHLYGQKPYDRNIYSSENLSVSVLALGEGWHNYHHTFPWDYKTSELGKYSTNFSTAFIDLMAKIGWAYDLKTVSEEMVRKRVQRTGDGSHELWGWNDKDQTPEEKREAVITYRQEK